MEEGFPVERQALPKLHGYHLLLKADLMDGF